MGTFYKKLRKKIEKLICVNKSLNRGNTKKVNELVMKNFEKYYCTSEEKCENNEDTSEMEVDE